MLFGGTSNSSYVFSFPHEYLLSQFRSSQKSQLISFLESQSKQAGTERNNLS